ncbi:MAG TPA: hypothetical protein VGR90_00980, partial [Acidimicrobiales bacterium]|nr:hypothetical protein [Acidimicrobiales bacterium]
VPTSGSLPPELDDAITSPERIPGSPLSLREAVAVLAHLPPASSPVEGAAPAPVAPRWLKVAGACSAATLAAAGLFVYHPPRAVITAGTPIDVSADVEVAGAPGPPRTAGRFELLWVEVDRPSLAGYLVALARGGATAPADSVTDPAAAERAGRADYLDSQKAAAAAGARLVGVDPVRVHVTFRDRGLTGPSAGLVYALVVAEDLSGRDLTGGRVVAATGTISPDGSVGAVGWVAVKALGATGIGASLLLVPADEVAQAHAYQGRLFGVDSLDEALQDLVGSRTIATCSPGPCSSGWTSRRPRIGR